MRFDQRVLVIQKDTFRNNRIGTLELGRADLLFCIPAGP
jgi:hypothetical protein